MSPCVNDTPHLDVDAPIPYELTENGLLAMLEYEVDHHPANCSHEFRWAGNGTFECRKCGVPRRAPAQSIPSYLAPKGRYER